MATHRLVIVYYRCVCRELFQVSVIVPAVLNADVNMEPYDIALYSVDGRESVLYWTDSKYNYIRAVQLDGRSAKIILRDERQKPRIIAVEPDEG
jgi:Low-density lipoprotein receptor repeat class B